MFFNRCDHENRVSAEKCVDSIIGGSNTEHFFVATQDADIGKKFREVRTVQLPLERTFLLFEYYEFSGNVRALGVSGLHLYLML